MQPLKPSVKGERRYPCGFPGCKWVFTRSNHVLRHHQRVHPGYAKHGAGGGGGGGMSGVVASSKIINNNNSVILNKNNNNGSCNLSPQDLSPAAATSVSSFAQRLHAHQQQHKQQKQSIISSPYTQSEAERFRELMSRSLIKCDVPNCDQTFKSAASLARHKTCVHAIDEEDEEEDQEDDVSSHAVSNSSLLLPSLLPANLIAAAAAAAAAAASSADPRRVLGLSASDLSAISPALQSMRLLKHRSEDMIGKNSHRQDQVTATGHLSVAKPFICSIDSCGKCFTRRDHLKRHQVQAHLQQHELSSDVSNTKSSEVILEEDHGDESTGEEDAASIMESHEVQSNNEPPVKRVRTSAQVVLEDEADCPSLLQQQQQASQENMMRMVSMAMMAKSRKNAIISSMSRKGEEAANGRTGGASSGEEEEEEDSEEEGVGAEGRLEIMMMAQEEENDPESGPSSSSNSSLLLPPIAMEPEVLLEVDEDIVWQPAAAVAKLHKNNAANNNNNNSSTMVTGASRSSLHPAMDRTSDLGKGSMNWPSGHENDNFSDADDNDVSSSSFPDANDAPYHQQPVDHQILQQLILSRALLGSSGGGGAAASAFPSAAQDDAYGYAQAILQQRSAQQQQSPLGKDRPYVCDVPRCDKRYTKHSHLVRHKVETHKMQKPEPRQQQLQPQSQSSSSLSSQQQQPTRRLSLTAGQTTGGSAAAQVVHHHPPPPNFNLNDRPYVCDFPGCRWSFKRQYHLDRHFLTHRQHQQNDSGNPEASNSEMEDHSSHHLEETSGDMIYENYESNDDNNSQDLNIVQSSKSNSSPSSACNRLNGSQGTSLLSPSPLNLKTSSDRRDRNDTGDGSSFNFSSSLLQSSKSPSPAASQPLTSTPKSKKSSPVTSLSVPASNTASALINATTGTNPVKINTTTPGNFTCCFPGCGIKCQSQSSFDAHLYLNHIVTNPLYNKKNKKNSANLISETLLLLEQNAILNHCNQQQKQKQQQQQQAVSSNKCPPKNSKISSSNNLSHSQDDNSGEQSNDLTMIQAYSLSLANLMNAVNQTNPSSSPSSNHSNNNNHHHNHHYSSIPSLPSPESSSSSPSDVEYSASVHSSGATNYSGDRKGEKALFMCDIEGCDKKFGRNCELTRHKLNHMDIWPFTCESAGCGRKFKRKDVFKNHLRTHVKEFPATTSPSPSVVVVTTAPSPAFTASS